jgi:hypothetical protein
MRNIGAFILLAGCAAPALAGKTYPLNADLSLTPIVDARLRYENVNQDSALNTADAITLRARAGIEAGHSSGLGVLIEGEGTLSVSNSYNSTTNGRTTFSTVADPENLEFSRFDLHYRSKSFTATVGRQRINLDDQRFVGSVGWRQNEQTFDAVTAEAKLGPATLNGTFAISQRTIFGVDAGPREHYDGRFYFMGAGAPVGPLKVKAFAYVIEYDAGQPVSANSTNTYGARATGSFKLTPKLTLNVAGSAAAQTDAALNPVDYLVAYYAFELGLVQGNYGLTGGLEMLNSEKGKAFQTPLATLHKFNGWADMFLTTPGQGLRDYYLGATAKFPKVKALPGLNAGVTWHYFTSDAGQQKFGHEWDAQVGFKLAGKFSVQAKYADFNRIGSAKFAGDVSTRKFWFQVEYGL